jgi:hypothetical protein
MATVFGVLLAHADASLVRRTTKNVSAGQSIQSAISAAHSGDKIVVGGGTYTEQLVIKADGITIVGTGATLVAPAAAAATNNECTGLTGEGQQAGVCVFGVVELDGYNSDKKHMTVTTVTKPVKGFSLSGFDIRNFDVNVALVGASDAVVSSNLLGNAPSYALLSVGSTNTKAKGNQVTSKSGLPAVGMCMDDKAVSHFVGNSVSGYAVALDVQTNGGDILQNYIRKCCAGVLVEKGVLGAQIQQNDIGGLNSASCPYTVPGTNGGVIIASASNSLVKGNNIVGQVNHMKAGGVVILDKTTVASGNVIQENVIQRNDKDVLVVSAGTGNKFVRNVCSTSSPAGLCVLT